MLPPVPPAGLHNAVLSDPHQVASHPVTPTRVLMLAAFAFGIVPAITTSPDPSAMFATPPMLSALPSYDAAPLMLPPTTSPHVTTARMLPPAPDPAAQVIPVSDTHAVRSLSLPPPRTLPLFPESPSPTPYTLTTALDKADRRFPGLA